MNSIPLPTLREAFTYLPETGHLFWKQRPRCHFASDRGWRAFNAQFAGKHVGCSNGPNQYLVVTIADQKHYVHRIAFALAAGEWPPGDVDHINGNRTDNRAANLRSVDRAGNMKNAKRSSANSSGCTGVVWDSRRKTWVAQIKVNYQNHFLGSFSELADATAARKAGEVHFGFHKNHGRAA
jgi:hypothetical protein